MINYIKKIEQMKGMVDDVTANFRQRCYFSYTDLYASAGI